VTLLVVSTIALVLGAAIGYGIGHSKGVEDYHRLARQRRFHPAANGPHPMRSTDRMPSLRITQDDIDAIRRDWGLDDERGISTFDAGLYGLLTAALVLAGSIMFGGGL